MSGVRLAARLVLIAVFLVSGVAKLADRQGTRKAVAAFGVPARWVTAVSWGLPLAELATAGLLACPATVWVGAVWVGAVAALILLAAFSVGIAVNLGQGRTPDCRCFGQLSSQPLSAKLLVRNAALAVPAVLLILTA